LTCENLTVVLSSMKAPATRGRLVLQRTQEIFHCPGRLARPAPHRGAVGLAAALLSLSLLAAGAAAAQPYPLKPVRLVVPYAAGGAVDTIARILGEPLAGLLGQPVVVDDKPGAGGNIGAEFVAKSAPDGYTLLLGSVGLATSGALFEHPGFDTLRDFAPVERVGYAPLVFVVQTDFPAATLQDLIRLARAKPGTLTYASAGNGSSGHLAGELLRSMAGIDIVHAPYKGGAPAMTDLLGGRISFMANNPIEVIPHIRAQRVRALAVGSAARFAPLSDVPTVAEQGLPGYEATVWWGILAPARTPPAVLARLSADMGRILNNEGVRRKLSDAGVVVDALGPAEFEAFLRREIAKWAQVIKTSAIRAD
jgi:tripartite-type tricarboxylate transporter receptor subunit TctC